MTRVDFYILQAQTEEARMLFVCRLTEKAVKRGNRVLIVVANEAIADALDDLLWSFRPESFIPHALAGSEEAADVPVVISAGADQSEHHDLLVSLTAELPPFFSRFERMAEVVVQAPEVLAATREHYAFLRQRGYPIDTHKLAVGD
jgi:DNA polymerase-3 subunit chi